MTALTKANEYIAKKGAKFAEPCLLGTCSLIKQSKLSDCNIQFHRSILPPQTISEDLKFFWKGIPQIPLLGHTLHATLIGTTTFTEPLEIWWLQF